MTTGAMTDTDVQTDVLEGLEFELPCHTRTRRKVLFWSRLQKDCPHPARWTGIFPCCGADIIACQPHRTNGAPWTCCGHDFPAMRIAWSKI